MHAAKERLQLVESSDLDLQIDRVQENIPHVVASPSFTYEDWYSMAEMAEALDQYNEKESEKLNKKTSNKMQATLNSASFWHFRQQRTTPPIALVDDDYGFKP